VELRGEDLLCYSNKYVNGNIANKVYFNEITATHIYISFIHEMVAKTSQHRYETKLGLRHCRFMYIKLLWHHGYCESEYSQTEQCPAVIAVAPHPLPQTGLHAKSCCWL